MNRILTIITLISIVPFLTAFVSYLIYRIYGGYSSLKWPHVIGNVVKGRITHDYGSEDDVYTIRIEYSYTIKNKEYKSKRLSYKFMMLGCYQSRKIYKNLVHENKVKVFYNPKKPSQSVLIPEYTIGPDLSGIIVSLIIIYAFLVELWRII